MAPKAAVASRVGLVRIATHMPPRPSFPSQNQSALFHGYSARTGSSTFKGTIPDLRKLSSPDEPIWRQPSGGTRSGIRLSERPQAFYAMPDLKAAELAMFVMNYERQIGLGHPDAADFHRHRHG